MDIETERERDNKIVYVICIYEFIYIIYIYTNIYNSSRSRRQVMKLDPLDVGGN